MALARVRRQREMAAAIALFGGNAPARIPLYGIRDSVDHEGLKRSPGGRMTYKTSAFIFMAFLVVGLGTFTALQVASDNRVRSARRVADRSELASAQLSRVR